MRTPEEEWNVILGEYKPPHLSNSRATEEMWQLLSAAHNNPTFRALYHGSCSSSVCAGQCVAGAGVGMSTATVIMNVC
ncbi:hypothetical protein ABZT28_56465, partial [Streptomyces sp. NPDC005388]|uniref:hypothetical protein n=1 Tax=Streptomyces sp. NPDC005388 TaxID=3156717 RepID=UPI0033BE6A35